MPAPAREQLAGDEPDVVGGSTGSARQRSRLRCWKTCESGSASDGQVVNSTVLKIAEQWSQPNFRVNELDLIHLRPYVESFLDLDWLREQLDEYEHWGTDNSDPFLRRNLLHRPIGFNMLGAAIWAARSWEDIYQEDQSFRPPMGPKRLINIACSLAVLELHAGSQLDVDAREYLQQRLQASGQLWGVVHECETFAYFIQKGFAVEPFFLKKASRKEIVIQWDGREIPVQCKSKMPGAGQAISQESFTTLAGCLAHDVKLSGQKLTVRIGSTGSVRPQDIDFLRKQVRSGVGGGSGPALVTTDTRTFTVKTEPLAGTTTVAEARVNLAKHGFHLTMGIWEPESNGDAYDAVVVVGIDAEPEENPWDSLESSIKDGAKQLRGGPPGIVAVHYQDPLNDFEQLRPSPEPMRVHIGRILESLPHVGAVILSSEPDLQLPGAGDPGRARIYSGREWRFPADFSLGELISKGQE